MPGAKGTCLPTITLKTLLKCLDAYKVLTFNPYTCSTHKEEYVSMNLYVTNYSYLWDGDITKALNVITLDEVPKIKEFHASFCHKESSVSGVQLSLVKGVTINLTKAEVYNDFCSEWKERFLVPNLSLSKAGQTDCTLKVL